MAGRVSVTGYYLYNIEIDDDHRVDREILVRSNLLMLEYRLGKQSSYGGRCRHLLRVRGDGFEIALKRVDLINCDGIFETISVPF